VDIKAYIESGVIESYVLGLASAEEATELEMLCQQHADIKNAVAEFEMLIEKQAFKNAVAPPTGVKDKLMLMLENEFAPAAENNKKETPVIPLTPVTDTYAQKSTGIWKYMAAASVLLLVGSAALNLYLYNNYQDTTTKYQALLTERNSLQANNDVFQTRLNGFEESMRVIENPDVQTIALNGVAGKENNLAAVYYNTKTKDVYYLPTKMDQIPADKQYQLWAIVDGKPVDAGIIESCDGLCKLKNIPNAQAFAITLENKGGSPVPTLTAMYVLGKV